MHGLVNRGTHRHDEARCPTLGALVALAAAVVLIATAPGLPLVWDEGDYLLRADQILAWFRLLVNPFHQDGGFAALSSGVIARYWWFTTGSEGHPAWFVVPIAVGKYLLSAMLDPLTAARLGPIAIFAIACGSVAARLKEEFGPVAAAAAPLALLTLPRLFSEAHFATQDGQLTAMWLMLWAIDTSPRRTPRTALGVGAMLGLSAATKFTGWLALIPVIGWRAWTKHPRLVRELWLVLPAMMITFYLVNPPLWHHPVSGMIDHVRLNLERPDANLFGSVTVRVPPSWQGQTRAPVDFRHYFFGSMTDETASYYPWYNTLAWLAIASPLPTLILGCLGLVTCWRSSACGVPLVFHWLTLTIVRALPGAPAHDGIRLFLPAFGLWCVIAAIGAQDLWNRASNHDAGLRQKTVIAGLLTVALIANSLSVVRYYPQTLSHYSILVGGVRGAARLGFEPTYWWDALDDDVLRWINEHTASTDRVAFSAASDLYLFALQTSGRLRVRLAGSTGPEFKWYVIQNRPGLLSKTERAMMQNDQPVYVKYPGPHVTHVAVDLKVPLIAVFSSQQYRGRVAAMAAK